jgi:phosphoadenosine phosphosulfate reductase
MNMHLTPINLAQINLDLGRNAQGLVEWAVGLNQSAIITTNFRPFEAVILHLVTRANPKVPVVWMDNGYNTDATYRFADEVTKLLKLNLHMYLPLRSRAHREAIEGSTPAVGDPRHAAFTQEVKLEPFTRALVETAPKVWFTALRATDTSVRAQMELHAYCTANGLPNNFDYVDPTKGEDNRECGLHVAH